MPTPVAPGLKVGKEQFSEESQGAVTLRVLLAGKNHREPPPASCLLYPCSQEAAASVLPKSEATSSESALSASSALFPWTRWL